MTPNVGLVPTASWLSSPGVWKEGAACKLCTPDQLHRKTLKLIMRVEVEI